MIELWIEYGAWREGRGFTWLLAAWCYGGIKGVPLFSRELCWLWVMYYRKIPSILVRISSLKTIMWHSIVLQYASCSHNEKFVKCRVAITRSRYTEVVGLYRSVHGAPKNCTCLTITALRQRLLQCFSVVYFEANHTIHNSRNSSLEEMKE